VETKFCTVILTLLCPCSEFRTTHVCGTPKFIFTINTEFLKLAPHLVYLTSANWIIRSNELERLGQGIIILQFEVHFDIYIYIYIYGATLVNHDKPVTVLGLRFRKKTISE